MAHIAFIIAAAVLVASLDLCVIVKRAQSNDVLLLIVVLYDLIVAIALNKHGKQQKRNEVATIINCLDLSNHILCGFPFFHNCFVALKECYSLRKYITAPNLRNNMR